MATSKRYDNSRNPISEEEENDIDDDTFLRHSKTGNSGYIFGSNDLSRQQRDFEDKREQLLERKRQIEERTVESSNRSIGLLRDSEQIGVATAEEILRQREQLERTEKRLDDINNTLRFSQKHIQSIKSVFGSLKNYVSGKGNPTEPQPGSTAGTAAAPRPSEISRDTNVLASRLDAMGPVSPTEHPGLRIRGLGDDQNWNPPPATSAISDANKILDNNLEEMCGSLARLRGLAEGLGGEIESQNEMLDRIHGKTDKADLSIDRQNRDMKRLLKK